MFPPFSSAQNTDSYQGGSSREQAATAILAKGIPLVVAGSFGNIFSRNCMFFPALSTATAVTFTIFLHHLALAIDLDQFILPVQQLTFAAINNALMGVEVPRLVQRLREAYKDQPKQLTRRTGWKLLWDVRRSKVVVIEDNGETWSQKVGELPPNVQEIIARGGLEKWVKAEISKST